MRGLPKAAWSGREPTRSSACTSTRIKDKRAPPLPDAAAAPILLPNAEPPMTQTNNRFFDEVATLMHDAAGGAGGGRGGVDTMMGTPAERLLGDLDGRGG